MWNYGSYRQLVGLLRRVISLYQGRLLYRTKNIEEKRTSMPWVGVRTQDPSVWAVEYNSCLRPRGHCDMLFWFHRHDDDDDDGYEYWNISKKYAFVKYSGRFLLPLCSRLSIQPVFWLNVKTCRWKTERELLRDENTKIKGLSQGSDRVLYWDYHHHVRGGMLINRLLLAERKLPSLPSTNQL
jgi:hypothetical protein